MQAGALAPSVHATVEPIKVTIIVGPVGATTANYRSRADTLAATAEAAGAVVTKVYSPDATWANVMTAVNGANVVVYLGHGNGFPNPYSATLGPERVDGWGLNRVAGIDPADPTGDGDNWSTNLAYCGEAALEGKPLPAGSPQATYCAGGPITPAPAWVMIYSNACYTPGAGETESTTPTSESTALSRVANYSRPALALNAGAYFASDIGSGSVLDKVLRNRDLGFGDIFSMASGFSAVALRTFPHPTSAGDQVWIQRTSGPGGIQSYWYAFGGDPTQTPNGGHAALSGDYIRPTVLSRTPAAGVTTASMSTTVTIGFSEPVSGVNGTSVRVRDTLSGGLYSGTVTYDPGTATATFVGAFPFQPARRYQVELSGAIGDSVGNPLLATSWSWTTTAWEVYSPWRSVRFSPASFTGYRFYTGGVVAAMKAWVVTADTVVQVSRRARIPGQPNVSGAWYFLESGPLAGWWVRERWSNTPAGFNPTLL